MRGIASWLSTEIAFVERAVPNYDLSQKKAMQEELQRVSIADFEAISEINIAEITVRNELKNAIREINALAGVDAETGIPEDPSSAKRDALAKGAEKDLKPPALPKTVEEIKTIDCEILKKIIGTCLMKRDGLTDFVLPGLRQIAGLIDAISKGLAKESATLEGGDLLQNAKARWAGRMSILFGNRGGIGNAVAIAILRVKNDLSVLSEAIPALEEMLKGC